MQLVYINYFQFAGAVALTAIQTVVLVNKYSYYAYWLAWQSPFHMPSF